MTIFFFLQIGFAGYVCQELPKHAFKWRDNHRYAALFFTTLILLTLHYENLKTKLGNYVISF